MYLLSISYMVSFEFGAAAVQDQFDSIDLSDNEIVKLENFPYLNRLGTLIVNNNRITRINPNIGGQATDFFLYVLSCFLDGFCLTCFVL